MGRNLLGDMGQWPEVTQHTGSAFDLVFALAFHALDQNFEGMVPQRKLMATSRLKPKTFYRVLHDVECSGEVVFYERPGYPCKYFMWWMYAHAEMREGRLSPITLEWSAQFQQLGRNCPRPKRNVWTDQHTGKIRHLFAVNTARRETARKARQK